MKKIISLIITISLLLGLFSTLNNTNINGDESKPFGIQNLIENDAEWFRGFAVSPDRSFILANNSTYCSTFDINGHYIKKNLYNKDGRIIKYNGNYLVKVSGQDSRYNYFEKYFDPNGNEILNVDSPEYPDEGYHGELYNGGKIVQSYNSTEGSQYYGTWSYKFVTEDKSYFLYRYYISPGNFIPINSEYFFMQDDNNECKIIKYDGTVILNNFKTQSIPFTINNNKLFVVNYNNETALYDFEGNEISVINGFNTRKYSEDRLIRIDEYNGGFTIFDLNGDSIYHTNHFNLESNIIDGYFVISVYQSGSTMYYICKDGENDKIDITLTDNDISNNANSNNNIQKETTKTKIRINNKPGTASIGKIYKRKKSSKRIRIVIKRLSNVIGYNLKILKKKKSGVLVNKYTQKIKNTITSKRIKGKKKLFIKVRAYNVINNKKIFGKWSKTVVSKAK